MAGGTLRTFSPLPERKRHCSKLKLYIFRREKHASFLVPDSPRLSLESKGYFKYWSTSPKLVIPKKIKPVFKNLTAYDRQMFLPGPY